MERLAVENHVFHRTCFKCQTCSAQLKAGSYEFDRNTDQFYCRMHYRDILRQRTVKRTMEQRKLGSPERDGEDDTTQAPRRKKKFFDTRPPEEGEPAKLHVSRAAKSTAKEGRGAETSPGEVIETTPTDTSRRESPHPRPSPPVSPDKKGAQEKLPSTPSQSTPDQTAIRLPRTSSIPSKPRPPISSVSVANGDVRGRSITSVAAVPQQPKQLPGVVLSGQQVAIDKGQDKKLEIERGEREKERKGQETGAERTTDESPPIKPPRRRTQKSLATGLPKEAEKTSEKVLVTKGQVAMFNCYLCLLFSLIVYCISFGIYSMIEMF